MSKSRKLHGLITEQEQEKGLVVAKLRKPSQRPDSDVEIQPEEEKEHDSAYEEQIQITLPDFPGGCDSFEAAAKFCYGVKIDLSAANAAALRCAGEYLEMTEEYSEDNLSHSVLKNVRYSIKVLASCQKLIPAAEDLTIVQRCITAIADKAAAADLSLFGWPVNDGAAIYARPGDTWLDELGFLSLPFFKRLILATDWSWRRTRSRCPNL